MAVIGTNIEHLQNVISEVLLEEWEAQGHSINGKVVKDMEFVVKQETDKLTLSGLTYPYANYQAYKTRWPNKRPPIAPLQRYVQMCMGITDEKKSKSIAFAIATNLKKQGMPTSGGARFSKNGRRLDWIEIGLKNDRVAEAISELAETALSASMEILVKKWNVELSK